MIIDKILDRKDGQQYNPKEFYIDMMNYEADNITKAMDNKDNIFVQSALCNYIVDNGYNLDLLVYITSNNWL